KAGRESSKVAACQLPRFSSTRAIHPDRAKHSRAAAPETDATSIKKWSGERLDQNAPMMPDKKLPALIAANQIAITDAAMRRGARRPKSPSPTGRIWSSPAVIRKKKRTIHGQATAV